MYRGLRHFVGDNLGWEPRAVHVVGLLVERDLPARRGAGIGPGVGQSVGIDQREGAVNALHYEKVESADRSYGCHVPSRSIPRSGKKLIPVSAPLTNREAVSACAADTAGSELEVCLDA